MKYILILLFSFSSFAYVISKGENGRNLKWVKQDNRIDLIVNPIPIGTNAAGVDTNSVINIFQSSIDNWNQYSPFEIVPTYTTNVSSSRNTVQFSNDTSILGPGVLAITEVNYNASSGIITSANIYFNEGFTNSFEFTDDETQSSNTKAYLGDVMTHELGHFLGLSHSEVIGSSMIFSVFKNQHVVHTDDYLGVWDNYGTSFYSGEIKGVVQGGEGVEVFGANVSLISMESMKVVQAQLTDESGNFHFKNVDTGESYIIYTSPFKNLSTISNYYSTAVDTFCSNGASYRQGFFTECGPSSASRPQGIQFSSSNIIDVGEITIRCDENINPQYLATKNETSDKQFQLVNSFRKSSYVFYGLFTSEELSELNLNVRGDKFDEYEIDLRYLDIDSPGSYQLKLDLVSSGISSAHDFYVFIKRGDESGYTEYTQNITDETGKKLTDVTINLSLSSTAENNSFSVRLYPKLLSNDDKYAIFSVLNSLSNSNSLYLISAQVGQYNGSDFVPYSEYGEEFVGDNARCLEGEISFATQAFTSLSTSDSAAQLEPDEQAQIVSCATVDFDNNNPSGPSALFSFLFGLSMIFGARFISFKSDNFV